MLKHLTWLILVFFVLLTLPKKSFSQAQELSFGISGVLGIPDTAYFGDVINVEFWLKNTTSYPTTIDGLLEVTFATDSTLVTSGPNFLSTSTQSSFSPLSLYLAFQDSVKITFTETINQRFAVGDNITVVWPKVVNGLPVTAEFSISKIYVMGFHSNVESNTRDIILFPNPTENTLSLKTLGVNTRNFDVCIFDALGNMILEKEDYSFLQPLSVKSLEAGIYFIQWGSNTAALKPEIRKFTKK